MTDQFVLRALRMVALAGAASLGACTTVLLPSNVTPVVAPSQSPEQAARRLREVAAARSVIEADYAAAEQVCYAKFFVNNCLDMAKEKRRAALAYLHAVEVEAEYFQRKAAVEQRDREVAQAIAEFEAGQARLAAQPAPAPRVAAAPAPQRAPKASLEARRASREARLARRAAQEQADAPGRAAKARQFEERRLKSLERQREVEEKKAEKAAKASNPAS